MTTKQLLALLLTAFATSTSFCQNTMQSSEWLKMLNEHRVHNEVNGDYQKAPNGLALYFADAGNIHVPYLVYVPRGYDGTKALPLVVFLHGAILAKDSFQYKDPTVAEEPVFSVADKLSAIIVFPFARTDFAWSRNTVANENIMNIISQVGRTYHVARKRVYIGGISMGGNATYWFVNHKADSFAGFYAFSSMPQTEKGIHFQNITTDKPLYTMNAKDDPGFHFSDVAAIYNAHKQEIHGWHFYAVENGGHRFIYGNDGSKYISQLLGMLLQSGQ